MTETPSCLRICRNACLPEMYAMGPDDKLSCVSLPDAPLLRAARRESVPYTPVWLMRQAGRYLPEYRAMRERFGFLELCRNPEAAAEVTLQPVDRLGVDAAILFADILLIVEPLDVGLEFARGEGPLIRRPLRDEAQIRRLAPIDVEAAVRFVFETARRVKRALAGRAPLIGFAGAPFTVASYLVGGGRRRHCIGLASGPRHRLGEPRPRRRGAGEPRSGGAPRQASVHPSARERHPRPRGQPAGPHLQSRTRRLARDARRARPGSRGHRPRPVGP